MKKVLVLLIGLIAVGCIGTDVLDDQIVDEKISINQEQVGLLVGTTQTLTATYTNEFGIESDTELSWRSDDPTVASVDDNGTVTAIGEGQTLVRVSGGTVTSEPLLISVRMTAEDIIKVLIEEP